MTRTDIHSPRNMNPAQYVYEDAFDASAPKQLPKRDGSGEWWTTGDGKAEALLRSHPVGVYSTGQDAAKCDHCGAWLRYVAVLRYLGEGGGFIGVGFDCLDNRFELTDKAAWDRQRLASAHKTRLVAEENAKTRQAFKDENPALYAFLVDAHENPLDHLPFVVDVANKFFGQYPNLTERQIAALERCRKGREKFLERQAEDEKTKRAPAPEGKGITIVGQIIKFDARENEYGTRFVVTIKTSAGWICWGTLPKAILHANEGDRVEFVANLERGDDASFAFFSRPRKARVLGAEEPDPQAPRLCAECSVDLGSVDALHTDKCPDCEGLPF